MSCAFNLDDMMMQLVEKKRRAQSLEAYRQADPAAEKQKRDAALRRMLKDEPAPQSAPQFTAEPTITPQGVIRNAYKQQSPYRTILF